MFRSIVENPPLVCHKSIIMKIKFVFLDLDSAEYMNADPEPRFVNYDNKKEIFQIITVNVLFASDPDPLSSRSRGHI
jgi:hypothetical protein